jgi:hypothetical protein
MNVHLPAPRRGWPARLVILAVVVVVLALAAAAFVLSYTGVHEIALQAGVSSRLARVYPGTFDAVLVIACVAAVVLRDARWWARGYAWLSIILMVGVVGAADAVHAMNVVLPHRQMEGVVAAAPWVLVLLGFSLLLTILQHTRAQHAAASGVRAAGLGEKQVAALPPAGEPAPTLVVPILAEAETATAAEYGPGEAAALGPAAAPESGPFAAPDTYPAAAQEPAERVADSGEGALSWHAYWDRDEESGPVPQGSPTPAAEAAEPGHPDAEADPADPPYPAATVPAPQPDYPATDVRQPDDDAPPFATAPFASVPRLNRVRSTPTPPEADEE